MYTAMANDFGSVNLGRNTCVCKPIAGVTNLRIGSLLNPPYSLLKSIILNGGPTGAVGAFIFVMAGVLTQVLVMAEMASMSV